MNVNPFLQNSVFIPAYQGSGALPEQGQALLPLPFFSPPDGTRECVRGEKYRVGECVAVQQHQTMPWRYVFVNQICRGRMACHDVYTGILLNLPFRHFRKIVYIPPMAGFVPVPFASSTAASRAVPTALPAPIEPVVSLAPTVVDSIPSVEALVQEFSQRSFCTQEACHGQGLLYGYVATSVQKVDDRRRLQYILQSHNRMFHEKNLTPEQRATYAGMSEKVQFPAETHVFVRADFHSDLATLIAHLNMLRMEGYLDETFKCRPNFRVVLLGDYIDRGVNDLEILSLLLAFRMENPTSVFLIRGNHEDVELSLRYTSDEWFLREHRELLSDCFETFPMSLCVASQESYTTPSGIAKHQYVHFSHGLFSPASISSIFLDGSTGVFLQEKQPVFKPFLRASEKANHAFSELMRKFQGIPAALDSAGNMWSDIGEETGPSQRGLGYVYSIEDVRLSLQSAAFRSDELCACYRGHQHDFQEHVCERKPESLKARYKVVATTLAAAMSSGYFEQEMLRQNIQGVILTVRPKVSDWQKQMVLLDIDESSHLPIFHSCPESISLYSRVDTGLNLGMVEPAVEVHSVVAGTDWMVEKEEPPCRLLSSDDL